MFILALFSPLVFSAGNKSQQIWGVFGRSTGILSYVSLLLIMIAVSTVRNRRTYQSIVNSLMLTTGILIIYCSIQWSGNDPISWSAFATFGTLGNVNFLSGFMGISLVIAFVLFFNSGLRKSNRILLLVLVISGLLIVASTDSIQGLVAFSVGIAIYGFFLAARKGMVFIVFYSFLLSCALLSLILALFDRGPLRSLIYQVTIVFRADYMQAGWKMMVNHPLTGVGIDSYDDWYRSERGVISAFRTGFNRTANTAHNVALDLGAGGGFPLLFSYFALVSVVLFAIVRGLKTGLSKDPIFVATTCAWISYHVQASVSINQIGVGIWGWILAGILIGYPNIADLEKEALAKRAQKTKHRGQTNYPPPAAVLTSFVLGSLAFIVAFLPFRADADFRSASSKGDLTKMTKSALSLGSNAFLLSQTNNLAQKNNLVEQSRTINNDLISRFPRNFYGWSVRASLPGLSESEMSQALRKLKELDPYQTLCLEQDSIAAIKKVLQSLPPAQQHELAKGWGVLMTHNDSYKTFSMSRLNTDALNSRLAMFCSG
jgi:O-antigen ligase